MGIIFLFAISALSLLGQAQPTVDGFKCFEELEIPEFPKAALIARVDGSVWTYTQVSPQGTVERLDTQVVSPWADGPRWLTAPVEKVIRAAKIKPECAGKLVTVVFRYQLY